MAILSIIVALTTTLFFAYAAHAVPATNKTINFQGRLLTSTGAVVPDGHYNIQFKIYQDGTGDAIGNPSGTLKWTESYVNDNAGSGVEVKNGFFSVSLGSKTSFGSSIDWSQDALWLSMNVAGSDAACTAFDTAPCAADGEMLPMRRITATPYAINAEQLGGKAAGDFAQIGQGTQTDASDGSSLAINKTGTGNLIQLQAGGNDAFVVNNAGSLTLGSSADQSISIAPSTSGAGKDLTVSSGAAASGSNLDGGDLILQGGAGDGDGTSGNVVIKTNGNDGTGTFQVQNTAGENVFNVDTKNTSVSVGSLDLTSSTSSQAAPNVSLWDAAPADGSNYNDVVPTNLGTTFKSDTGGYVTGVKFYSPANANPSGTNVGKLWACNDANCSLASGGTQLASVTFPADTTEGWKTANFSTPVYISPDTYYLVTYLSQNGIYHASSHYFDTNYDNAPLHAPGQAAGSNGSFIINSGGFPTGSNNNTNYWVDVAFRPDTKTDAISTENGLNITSGGPMNIGPSEQALSLQGSEINITAKKGGDVTIQGGDAAVSDSNGGSILLSGGAGKGTGTSGLVVMTTPTFSTVTNDANCYASGALVASSCTIAASSINNSAAVMTGFSAAGQTASVPDPAIKTAGRVVYVMAAENSASFTLSLNGGGAGNETLMRAGGAATIMWNGTDWTVAGTSSASALHDTLSTDGTLNVQVGDTDDSALTLLTLDRAAAAPTVTDEDAVLGSMYYDTTLDKMQCYESDGWGSCGASPDNFVTISPEYTNAVMNGNDIGTITSDLCSDTLNINDGSSSQPTICGTNETYNFYKWTSAESTDQTRSIYVTYQLPATFKKFVSGSTSLMGRTDSANSNVSYQIYRDDGDNGLASCGSAVSVSTGSQTTWQKAAAGSGADPANCSFEAGDSILFRINLSAKDDANAYVSNLAFTFNNN